MNVNKLDKLSGEKEERERERERVALEHYDSFLIQNLEKDWGILSL